MNEKVHWDGIGERYDHEIFDVFKSDLNRKLPFYFNKHASQKKSVLDFGCGNGKSFSYLSPLFGKILAIDISQELLNQAQQRHVRNVSFKRMDLSRRGLKLGPVDFLFCCNVVMLPVLEKNIAMLKNISNALKRTAAAVVILPALESALFSSWRLIDWYKREGIPPGDIARDELQMFKGTKTDIIQGIIYIDNVPTKHYTASELEVVFTRAGLKITALDKVEYKWDSEFQSPPPWMKAPYPWDWLVECKKV
jgi:SAM-dependent methyltransferase